MTQYKTDISSSHLNSDDLLNYHRRLFSVEENQRIEEHLKGCKLCSDALAGLLEMNDALHVYAITHELRKRMRKRFVHKAKIFSRNELITLVLTLFVLGVIIFLAYYFLLVKK